MRTLGQDRRQPAPYSECAVLMRIEAPPKGQSASVRRKPDSVLLGPLGQSVPPVVGVEARSALGLAWRRPTEGERPRERERSERPTPSLRAGAGHQAERSVRSVSGVEADAEAKGRGRARARRRGEPVSEGLAPRFAVPGDLDPWKPCFASISRCTEYRKADLTRSAVSFGPFSPTMPS